mmetsp:Transcript_123907/g.264148  ORF Transcript_123907/g.264148 Transcript_123907/m.264148 type:complete len:81 (-) Transcript_123907:1352-1594(-)
MLFMFQPPCRERAEGACGGHGAGAQEHADHTAPVAEGASEDWSHAAAHREELGCDGEEMPPPVRTRELSGKGKGGTATEV